MSNLSLLDHQRGTDFSPGPWFTPLVKTCIRETRYWERQIKRFEGNPNKMIFLQGSLYTLKECKARFAEANKCRLAEFNNAEQNSRDYIDRQIAAGNYRVIRRIFQSTHSSIPTLKYEDSSGKRQIEASCPAETAVVFRDAFVEISQLPPDFPDRPDETLSNISSTVSNVLTFYRCKDSVLERISDPGPTTVSIAMYHSTCAVCHAADRLVSEASNDTFFDKIDPNFDPISILEVSVARRSLKKGVGSIGLKHDHLRKLQSTNVDFAFQFLANLSWTIAYPYLDWRTSIIRPLHKGKGLDRAIKFSYRPIGNSHTVGKWMDVVVYTRLKYIALDAIVPYQAGGMAQNGAIHQLIRVCDTFQELISRTESDGEGGDQYALYIATALADCSKAFNRMDRRLIIFKLHREGVRGKL